MTPKIGWVIRRIWLCLRELLQLGEQWTGRGTGNESIFFCHTSTDLDTDCSINVSMLTSNYYRTNIVTHNSAHILAHIIQSSLHHSVNIGFSTPCVLEYCTAVAGSWPDQSHSAGHWGSIDSDTDEGTIVRAVHCLPVHGMMVS